MPGPDRIPRIIAHRGMHGPDLPENTLAAFEAAVAAGAEMIELDVRRTADGQLVIFHDPVCAGEPLATLGHAELEQAAGIEVPALADTLDWAAARGVPLDVELKENGYVETVAAMLAAFQEHGGELLVTSFIDAALAQLPPALRGGLLLSISAARAGDRARACGAQALVVRNGLLGDGLYVEAVAGGLDLYVWDYLPERDAPAASADPRIAGIITDDVPGTLAARAATAHPPELMPDS